jgi:hypothetical protein
VGGDGPLELAERREDELLPTGRVDDPALVVMGFAGRANLELQPAVRAFDGGSTAAYERVVELVLRLTPLALDVHFVEALDLVNRAAPSAQTLAWCFRECKTSRKPGRTRLRGTLRQVHQVRERSYTPRPKPVGLFGRRR